MKNMGQTLNIQPIHKDVVQTVLSNMPDSQIFSRLADFFKVFGDSTRIKILFALFIHQMCVYDLSALLGMQQSAISHQLRILKQSGLVKNRKQGKIVYYSLDDEHIGQIFKLALKHITEK
jgi:ArsR family transcriptional regulator